MRVLSHCPHFKRSLVDAYVHFAPDTAFGTAMPARSPLAFTFGFDACAVDKKVQRASTVTIRQADVQNLLVSA